MSGRVYSFPSPPVADEEYVIDFSRLPRDSEGTPLFPRLSTFEDGKPCPPRVVHDVRMGTSLDWFTGRLADVLSEDDGVDRWENEGGT